MKKLFSVFACLLLLITVPSFSSAEKAQQKDKSYDFSRIKNATITSIKAQPYGEATYSADFDLAGKVNTALKNALSGRNIKVTPAPDTLARHSINIAVNVEGLGVFTVHEDAYDETRTVDKKTVGKDENGKDIIVTIPTQEVVHHPAKDVPHAVAILNFSVTDSVTGKEIYSLRDSRERNDETDTSGMLGRICRDFAKMISKN